MNDTTNTAPAQGQAQSPSPPPLPAGQPAPAQAAAPLQPPSPFPPPLPAGQAQASAPAQSQQAAPPAPPKYILTHANEYGTQGEFDKDIAEFSSYANLVTGFPPLDRIQPFYPGLYCLGAISSLGKTTFALQLADQAAASGQWVIYFSLEQTRLSKTSSRLITPTSGPWSSWTTCRSCPRP